MNILDDTYTLKPSEASPRVSEELARTLTQPGRPSDEARAVILPDLFIDCLVPLDGWRGFNDGADRLINQGGGNLITPHQRLQLGGNAANTAQTLAGLGVHTTLIASTTPVGEALFDQATDGLPATLHAIDTQRDPSTTVALELEDEGANVMLSNPGPLARFGPKDLDPKAWALIEDADIVAITNWSQTLEHGTELLAEVLPRAKRAGATTFLDTGDPAHRGDDVHDLLQEPSLQDHLDVWGMNEHEARIFGAALTQGHPDDIDEHEAARALDEHVRARIDVHTATEAFSMNENEHDHAETFPIDPLHLTGAGDAWNAGALLGALLGLDGAQRLSLANAVAALTIAYPDQAPPTAKALARFLQGP